MLKQRLTYANVAATLALVFSMTGGALAANHYLITSTKQISPKVVKALKGKAGPAGKDGLPGKDGAPGKEGSAGKEGKEGLRGPSDTYEVQLGKSTGEIAASTPKTLTLENLPAGSYAIQAKAIVWPREAKSSSNECTLAAGSDKDESWTPSSSAATWFVTVNNALTHTFTTTGNVTLTCTSLEKWSLMGADSGETNTRIVAVRVDSQHAGSAEAS
jgi:hypothetical protein